MVQSRAEGFEGRWCLSSSAASRRLGSDGSRRRTVSSRLEDTCSEMAQQHQQHQQQFDLEKGQGRALCIDEEDADVVQGKAVDAARAHRRNARSWRSAMGVLVILVQSVAIVALIATRGSRRADDAAAGRHPTFIGTGSSAEHRRHQVEFLANQTPSELTHLIMVPGHGVTMTESLEGADSRDGDWFLLDYQKNKDVPRALVSHIRGGLDALSADASALLLFSGGKTRVVAGPKSEGESYFFVADHYDWWGKPELRARASTEDFARDSFENLLFSICRFKEITGGYPAKITVAGYDFKKERFETLHRAVLRFPASDFSYIGLRPEGKFDHAAAEKGEQVSALQPYRLDPYGCAPESALAAKRVQRDPFHRTPPYSLVCPEVRELFSWCGPEEFPGDLPWSRSDTLARAMESRGTPSRDEGGNPP